MTSRSIPSPRPPVGGNPSSRARRKSSIDRHRLVVTQGPLRLLLLEPGPLLVGIGQLAEGVAELPASDDRLETLHVAGLGAMGHARAGETSCGWSHTKTGPQSSASVVFS